MQHLDLSDDDAAALIKELADITGNDRYTVSSRIQTLRTILAKLRPEPARNPSPPPKVSAPPRATAAGRRRRG
jgi:ParB-like chromosome segregation protein Spo0J